VTSVVLLDVGHGNCAIVRSGDATAVVDCPTGSILLDTLIDLGVEVVEVAIISHADKDHIAGILSLLSSTRIRVGKVYVNPDSQKRTKVWRDFRVAVADAERTGDFEVILALSTVFPGVLTIGDATLRVLSPSSRLAATAVGGETLSGKTVTSNTLSGVLRVDAGDKPGVLLAGDMDDISLDDALDMGQDLSAEVLVFPHHGGLPGGTDPDHFADRLLSSVNPTTVIFSNGRNRHDNPKPQMVKAAAGRGCTVGCSELSARCHATPISSNEHLEPLRALGRASGSSCAGSMTFVIGDPIRRLPEMAERHARFVADHVSTPMCRHEQPRI
jgi:competence protein ComEC